MEYFVSYYDYYQPEAYLPTTDTYIEKDLSINDEIEKLRLSTLRPSRRGEETSLWSPPYHASTVSEIGGFHSTTLHIKRGECLAASSSFISWSMPLFTQ